MTLKVAKVYYDIFKKKTDNVHLISLEDWKVWERNDELKQLENEFLIPSDKFVFIMPEYNGSFPGILKLLLDNSDIKKCWWYKKIMLTGVADGRGGNLRGIEHMTNILHYLKMHVLYNKLPLSKINDEMNEQGVFTKPKTIAAIEQQVDEFLSF